MHFSLETAVSMKRVRLFFLGYSPIGQLVFLVTSLEALYVRGSSIYYYYCCSTRGSSVPLPRPIVQRRLHYRYVEWLIYSSVPHPTGTGTHTYSGSKKNIRLVTGTRLYYHARRTVGVFFVAHPCAFTDSGANTCITCESYSRGVTR